MHTIAHLSGFLAALWLSLYCFNDLNEDALGVATLGFAFVFLINIIPAAAEDWHQWLTLRGKRDQ